MAGLIELTTTSRLGLVVDLEQIHVSAETQHLCELFRIDPLVSLSEGSLIIASRPTKTEEVRAKLSSLGISSTIVGSLTSRFRGCKVTTSKGTRSLRYPAVDPYWRAYSKAIKRGWS
jgi:hydrogenase maturation factor